MANEAVYAILAAFALYGLVYRFYVRWFDRKVIQSDPTRPTPAHTYMDGVEFFPSNKYIMFGWHWKSVAALGPVTGPALAIVWGWLPALLWILIGTSLMGWLHDYNAMMLSVRNEGASLGPITHQLVSPRARKALVGFLAFYTILIFAAFLGVLVPVLNTYPEVSVAFYSTVIIAILAGVSVFKLKANIVVVTILSLIAVGVSVYLTEVVFAGGIRAAYLGIPAGYREDVWLILMFAFSFLGAVLPLWSFAMPVNYLTSYIEFAGIGAILLGAFFLRPDFAQPAFTNFVANLPTGASGALFTFAFPLWPLMFVTIACGACSGWHGLLGSSLSAKQLDNEKDAHFVGGGSMLLEGVLGLTSLIAVAILSPFPTGGVLNRYIVGGGTYLQALGISSAVAAGFIALMVVVLGLTLTQLALRFARLTFSELLGVRALKNIYLSAIVAIVVTYLLVSSRTGTTWGFIWTLFGGANQLLAGVTLTTTTLFLYKMKRPTIFTGIPAIFMLATTIAALIFTAYATFSIAFDPAITAGKSWYFSYGSILAGVIGIILVALGLIYTRDSWGSFRRMRAERMGRPAAPAMPSVTAQTSTPGVSTSDPTINLSETKR